MHTGDPAARAGSRGACLGTAEFEYRLTTDRPVTITFTDGRSVRITSAGTHQGTVPAAG